MVGTRFNIIDLSEVSEDTQTVTPDNAPLILACGPTAKGDEDMAVYSGDTYRKMFGDPDFKRFGQSSVQVQRMIDNGAKVLFKRVVATDAALANVTMLANIKVVPVKKSQFNPDGTPVYETETKVIEKSEPFETNLIVYPDKESHPVGYQECWRSTQTETATALHDKLVEKNPDFDFEVEYKRTIAGGIGEHVSGEENPNNDAFVFKVTKKYSEEVEVPKYTVTSTGQQIKIIQQAWQDTAEVGFVAVTDEDVQNLDTKFATNNLADKYRAISGMVPNGDDAASVADDNHVIIVPSADTIPEQTFNALAKIWGVELDSMSLDYNGYWVVDKTWTEEVEVNGQMVTRLAVPGELAGDADAVATKAHEAIQMHYRYPLFTVADIGRGSSSKSFMITPDNDISKNLPFMYYTMYIMEDGKELDAIRFSMLPDVIYRGECVDLEMAAKNGLKYSQVVPYEDSINAYVHKLAEVMGEDEETLQQNDFIFGTLRKGTPLAGVTISEEFTADMKTTGITLESGSDGAFTNSPMLNAPDLVNEKILAFFSYGKNEEYDHALTPNPETGLYDYQVRLTDKDTTPDIYDLDTYQIDACFGANYPVPINGAIGKLADYRNDFHFFRDHGLNCRTLADAEAMVNGSYYDQTITDYECELRGISSDIHTHNPQDLTNEYHKDLNNNGLIDEGLVTTGVDNSSNIIHSFNISDWPQAYDVINPYDLKQITVTITYDLSYFMISHILNKVNYPFAGERNGAVLTSILKDTLNYKPRVLPDKNEKDDLEDARCNFASYYKDRFIVETLYTSQTKNSQLSYINNIMAVQKVIKALRVKFPSIRYQFITSTDDLVAYTTEINEFLSLYSGMFAELRFEYIQDKVAIANKIYRAALYFRFNEFTQGEKIDAYMLPTEII